MDANIAAKYQALKDTPWEEAARRTVAFIGVGSQLLDPGVEVPAYAADLVEAELALIDDAGGLQSSPLFPGLMNGEDYSQYIPRGHYTLSEELKHYFRSMMWYGRMTFRLKTMDPEVGRAETRSGLLLVQALRNAQVEGRPALEAWMDADVLGDAPVLLTTLCNVMFIIGDHGNPVIIGLGQQSFRGQQTQEK